MRDKTNPAVVAHLNAENAYTAGMMAPTQALQATLYAAMLGRIQQTDTSVPYRRGAYEYYSRMEENRQYPIFCRRTDRLAPEAILLDLNERAAGDAYIALGDFVVSDDDNLLAFTLDRTGDREFMLYVQDLRSGAFVGAPIERVEHVVWATDNRTLIYVTQDPLTKRADTLRRRAIDSPDGEVLFEERDEMYDVGLNRTRDGRYIIVTSTAKDTSECRYFAADRPSGEPRLFAGRRDGIQYSLDVRDDRFYVRSNEAAPNFEIRSTPIATPGESWAIVAAQRPGATITAFEVFADFAVVVGRRDGLASIELLDFAAQTLTPVTFAEPDYLVELVENPQYATHLLRFAYESMIAPRSVYDLNVATGERTLLKRTDVPNYDPDAYTIERRFAPARDGTEIPVSIVQKKTVAHDGRAPLLLYGYGSYGVSIDSHFSAARLALLDRGMIYAVAHIRGGGEYGEVWRLAGNLMHKRTTFTDFIDVAEGLIGARYTSPDRLVIEGASAGGLLMGAVTNMRPDLFAAVVAKVPFVDVLTTMLDASLPLTTGEYREWGDPADIDAYTYMRGYSPLDNVAAQPYPALLIEVGYNDSLTPYWEGAKFAAKVRAQSTSGKPVLLKTNMQAGHGGSSGRYDRLREAAFTYAFILTQAGVSDEPAALTR